MSTDVRSCRIWHDAERTCDVAEPAMCDWALDAELFDGPAITLFTSGAVLLRVIRSQRTQRVN
jgi:hypothetical protein